MDEFDEVGTIVVNVSVERCLVGRFVDKEGVIRTHKALV